MSLTEYAVYQIYLEVKSGVNPVLYFKALCENFGIADMDRNLLRS